MAPSSRSFTVPDSAFILVPPVGGPQAGWAAAHGPAGGPAGWRIGAAVNGVAAWTDVNPPADDHDGGGGGGPSLAHVADALRRLGVRAELRKPVAPGPLRDVLARILEPTHV